jgi:hypothetical protein
MPKTALPAARLRADHGIEGDAHSGPGHRPVSILGHDDVENFKQAGRLDEQRLLRLPTVSGDRTAVSGDQGTHLGPVARPCRLRRCFASAPTSPVFRHRDFHDEINVLRRPGRGRAGTGDEKAERRSAEKDHPFSKRIQPFGHESNRLYAIQQHRRPSLGGEAILGITQIGKHCHHRCAIFRHFSCRLDVLQKKCR